IETIYNSVDPATLAPAPGEAESLRREFSIPEGGFVFLNVGRHDRPKGQWLVLRAFARLAARAQGALVALVGDGPGNAELRRLAAELGIENRVRFLGRPLRIAGCYALAHAFVFPSLFEGLPLSLVEAMLCGLPCVASGIGPHREVIEDGRSGLLV